VGSDAKRLGKYVLLRRLAVGGMGEVYLARQEGPAGFSKPVVVKQILPRLARDMNFVELFLNEARLAAQVNHPNVVQVFDLGSAAGGYFIAMEFVHGASLRGLQRKLRDAGRSLPPALALNICFQVLNGLHAAHTLLDEKGKPMPVIHRDVSPENVLVGFNGTVKLTDFGVAKAITAAGPRSGVVRGHVGYISPEQIHTRPLDARSDVFAVGVILYELLSGGHPFAGDSPEARVRSILAKTPPPLADHGVNSSMTAVVERALQKERDSRFATAAEMASALEGLLRGVGASASTTELNRFLISLYEPRDTAPIPEETEVSFAPVKTMPVEGRDRTLGPAPRKWLWAAAAAAGLAFGVWGTLGAPGRPSRAVAREATPATAIPQPRNAEAAATASALSRQPEQTDDVSADPKPVPPEIRLPAVRGTRPSARRGRLDLRVKPWAEVYLGGRKLGVTPMPPIELPAGTQTLTLVNETLGSKKIVRVHVPEGAETMLRVQLP
jgi:eukaryotic-like serine/threonine-protein kinase